MNAIGLDRIVAVNVERQFYLDEQQAIRKSERIQNLFFGVNGHSFRFSDCANQKPGRIVFNRLEKQERMLCIQNWS